MYSITYNAVWASMYLVREIPSDDVNAGGSGTLDQATYQQLDDFKHDSQGDHIRDSWQNLYRTIYRANQVVNNTLAEDAAMKQIVAEAKALRAFAYLDLVSFWGGVPIIVGELQPDEYTTQVRASKKEVLTFIQSDLVAAIPDLPLKLWL
jgi:hypothetical protein